MKRLLKISDEERRHILEMHNSYQKPLNEQNWKTGIGSGAAAGAAMGAAAGSAVPIVGTAVGGAVGGAVGAFTGAIGAVLDKWGRDGDSETAVKGFCEQCEKSQATPTQRSNQIADRIRKALTETTLGVFPSTNEQELVNALTSITSFQEFCSVVKSYQNSYKVSMFDDINGDIDEDTEWDSIMIPIRNLIQKK